jgi:hypothetical protein
MLDVYVHSYNIVLVNYIGMYTKINNTFIWFLHYMLVQVWKLSKDLAKRSLQAQNVAKSVKIVSIWHSIILVKCPSRASTPF